MPVGWLWMLAACGPDAAEATDEIGESSEPGYNLLLSLEILDETYHPAPEGLEEPPGTGDIWISQDFGVQQDGEPYGPDVEARTLGQVGFGEAVGLLLPLGAIRFSVGGDFDAPGDCSEEQAEQEYGRICEPTGWEASTDLWVGPDPLPIGEPGFKGISTYFLDTDEGPLDLVLRLQPPGCICQD